MLAGGFSAICGYGVYGAFSVTTATSASSLAAGTVTIGDSDAGTALYDVANALPGDPTTRCIKVTYTGTLSASVRLFRSSLSGALGPYVTLTITKGTGDSPDCSDFSADTSVYSGTLSAFPETYGAGVALTDGSGSATWAAGDAVTYRFTVEVVDDSAAANKSTGTHSFTWQSEGL